MELKFEREYYIRTSDFDCFGRLQPASVLDLFQDVAGLHAKLLGCGFDELIDRKLLWVLVRVKYKVLSDVNMFDKVRVKTWPIAPSRAGFRREYLIEREDGTPVIKGSSDWVMMHSELRRLVPSVDVYPADAEFLTQQSFEGKLRKIADFEPEGDGYPLLAGFSQLDINGHVNNTKYANFVLDAVGLGSDDRIDTVQIDYRHEVKGGLPLNILTKRDGREIFAKGVDPDGATMFMCNIELR